MLELALNHENKLQEIFNRICFDEKYMFYYSTSYREKFEISKDSWGKYEFVSISNGKILGYLAYAIDRDPYNIHSLRIINFGEKNLVFSRDLYKFLFDIFDRYKFNKINFGMVVGNPIEEMYDRVCLKLGGRVVGINKAECKLLDGNYYDYKLYEIMREDYIEKRSK